VLREIGHDATRSISVPACNADHGCLALGFPFSGHPWVQSLAKARALRVNPEIQVRIADARMYLWRAVDHNGESAGRASTYV
jgi:hypothetical protein